ncbi:hypothetical protein DFQ27_002029, partial [Actinomortierella ambigua]
GSSSASDGSQAGSSSASDGSQAGSSSASGGSQAGSSSASGGSQAGSSPASGTVQAAPTQSGTGTRLDALNKFYLDLTFDSSGAARTSKHWFLRNRWDAKKAKTGTMDIAIDAILRLGGGSSTVPRQKLQEKAEASMPQASPTPPIDGNFVLGIGSGEFRGKQQYSLHGPFLRRLVSKARALGIICCKVKEAYTSKKCPRPLCTSDLDYDPKDRSKWCPVCKVYFDRDVVGAENIARILGAHMQGQPRPTKFNKPDSGDGGPPGGGGGGGGGGGPPTGGD